MQVARHYKTDPIEALMVTGYLTEDEYENCGEGSSLRKANDRDLVGELYRRAILRFHVTEQASNGENNDRGLGAEPNIK